MNNITTVFGIDHRGHSCEFGIYAWSIVINLHISTKLWCDGGGKC